ncbi:MAG: OmpA family protein [Burkholderiales bacterium]|nr:OmpA family protein [Bacteroidia bacterium]
MRFFLLIAFGAIFYLRHFAQSFPNPLPFKTIEYIDKAHAKYTYDFSKPEKKAFLFFDVKSEPLAEVMYNGCNFVFTEKNIAIFPVYFTGQLNKKTSKDIPTKIPTQLFRSSATSIFKEFNLTETDFPILVVYNEKNELCGFSKNVEGLTEIDCGVEMVKFKVLRLKIMVEEKGKVLSPYANKPIVILGGTKYDTVAKLITNKYGDFNAELPDLNQDYLITVNEHDSNINFVMLGTQSGKIVGKFKSTDAGFEYRILKTELLTLPDVKIEDDVEMQMTNFRDKDLKDFIITETLFYELGESSLSSGSKKLLEKIKKILDTYPAFRMKVSSHTDAQGDDDSNLKLSVKRSETVIDYMSSLGINKERLSAEGKGELEIRNRCKNDVDCSDKEHEYNRRTEFKFSKK